MDYLLDLILSSDLNSHIIYFVVIILICLKRDGQSEGKIKVVLLYAFIFLLILMKAISFYSAVFLILLALFCHHEIFSSDTQKIVLFNIFQKIIDFFYCLFIEDYILLFLATYLFSAFYISNQIFNQTVVAVISLAFFMLSVLRILSNKFSTNDISTISTALRGINPNDLNLDLYGCKFDILTWIEDSSFFGRNRMFHTLLAPSISFGLFKRSNIKQIRHPVCFLRKIFCRGYSTIEMQLIRTLGVKSGYEKCVIKRKIFEVVFAHLIFNSLFNYYNFNRESVERYKIWILLNYINYVRVKINGKIFCRTSNKSSLELAFGKDMIHTSSEEFFVWCLGLSCIDKIGEKVVGWYDPIIEQYGLDKQSVFNIIKQIENS